MMKQSSYIHQKNQWLTSMKSEEEAMKEINGDDDGWYDVDNFLWQHMLVGI
jgi:hypothetical protein